MSTKEIVKKLRQMFPNCTISYYLENSAYIFVTGEDFKLKIEVVKPNPYMK